MIKTSLALAAGATLALAACTTPTSGNIRRLPELPLPESEAPHAPRLPAPIAVTSVSPARGESDESSLNGHGFFYLGGRTMDDRRFWDRLEHPIALGAEVEFRRESPFGLELGFALAGDRTEIGFIDVDSTFVELYVGGRLTGDLGDSVHPYVGAGGTFMYVDITSTLGNADVSDDDFTFGAYAHGGFYVDVTKEISLGADARFVFRTDVDLVGLDGDADYTQIAAFIGVGF